jgi:heme A synthase
VTFVSAWINRRRFPGALWAAAAAVLVIVVQIALGAWTVATGNRGDTVVAHLVAALLLLGAAAWTAVRSSARPYGRYRRPDAMAVRRRLAALAVVLAPVTLLVAGLGGAVQVVNGGLACPDFPFCGGALWPAGRGLPAELHMLHRAGAAGIGALLVVGAIWAWRLDRGPERLWLTLSLGLYAVQFAVGVAQVTLGMPFELRWAHLALAAALWGTVGTFTAYAVDGYVPAGLPEPRMSARLPGREAGA